jgi:hypothetical protein
VAGLSAVRLWHQPESERARESGAKRLIGLQQLIDLLGNDLDELLKLLELRGDDGQQLLEQRELLLLKELQLLKLLRHDLQQLRGLLSRRLAAESRADVGSEAPGILCHRINCWRSDSKPGSCELTHLTSSVIVDRTVLRATARALSRCRLRGDASALSA